MADCSEDGCERVAVKRGFCERDHMRHWRAGTLPPRAAKPPCTVCGEPSAWKGLCPTHYYRQYQRGTTELTQPVRRLPPVERFWAKVDKSAGPGGCWLWTAGKQGAGYGQFFWAGGKYLAHRFAYEMAFGPVPEGRQIDHVWARGCRHRHCVNPAHLEAVTLEENVRRAQTGHRPYYSPELQQARARRRLTARFWSRAQTGEADECWPWLGYIDPQGIARFWWEKASHPAQRIAFMLGSLEEAPEKFVVENSCTTPRCMNPDHLVAIPRALSKGNVRPGRREERSAAARKALAIRWGHPAG
jgi:hypothetical protein